MPDPADGDDAASGLATWSVYVLLSHDGSRTYCGITTDTARRLEQHNGLLPGGAKATSAWRPWSLGKVYGPFETRGQALRVERAIKRLRGRARLRYLVGG